MKNNTPANEASVRFCYANPIVVMHCQAFNMILEWKKSTKKGDLVNLSGGSKSRLYLLEITHSML